MSIAFACDFCSRKYRVDDNLAGRKVKCKECGTDLTIPESGAVTLTETDYAPKNSQAAHQDLYGLDDGDDAPMPAPASRRPGTVRSSNGRGQSIANAERDRQMWRVVGIVIAVLIAFPVGICIIGFVQNSGMLNPAPPVAAPDRFVNGPAPGLNVPAPNFVPPPQPDFAAPAMPGSQPPGIFLSLSDGKASQATSPTGRPSLGAEFRADYRINGERPFGVHQFHAVVKGSRKRADARLMSLRGDSGPIGISVMGMSQNDGPFEMYIEGEVIGPRGMQRHKVSETISLQWTDLPRQEQNPPQMPGQPGYRPPGMPNIGQPGNMPGQPGYRPPGFPNIPTPRFGPRGRP